MANHIPLFKVFMAPPEALMPKLESLLYSGQIGEGEPVYEFERQFSEFVELPNVLSLYSGTAALHLALMLAGVRQDDEVITTAMTAEPTNVAIRHAGAKVVWADVDPRNGLIDPESIRQRITPRTKAIMVVHYGGVPASMARIRQISEAAGIPVIEDAAHALGARYGGQSLGASSEYVMFSLQAIKHMTTVDGGMLACKAPADLPKGRELRWFGIDRCAPRTEVDVQRVGYKYHMNNLNATIGSVQLQHIRPVLDAHISNGRYFDAMLQGIPGLSLCSWDTEAEPSYWFYTVMAERRDDLSRRLTEAGIANSLVHKRNDQHSVFKDSLVPLPNLDAFYARMLHIPCGWWVNEEDRERIVEVICGGW